MNLNEFIKELAQHQIYLWVEDEKLRYRAPREAMTPEIVVNIQKYKPALIDYLTQPKGSAIEAVSRSQPIPLSFTQQRLWFLQQLEPNHAFYNVPIAVRFTGTLNLEILEQSFQAIVQRHEALRTNFAVVDGQLVQVIRDREFQIAVEDLRSLPEEIRDQYCETRAKEIADTPLNLEKDSLIRITVFQLSETEHYLALIIHHIVFDGWSMALLAQEFSTLYRAFSEHQPSPLPELTIQPADFAVWQRQWLQGDSQDTNLDYWKTKLNGAPTTLSLPSDRPRPAVQTFRGAYTTFSISADLSQAVQSLSQTQGVTLFMTLFAAFSTVLFRYTGQNDILVGTPFANRNQAEVERLISYFVTPLILRADLSGEPTFREVLQRVKQTALEAYAHPDIPFEELVEALHPVRDLSYSPLFQVMFILQNAPDALEIPGLQIDATAIDNGTAKFDLTFSVWNTPTEMTGTIEYSTDLFDADTIDRLIGHFQVLLDAVVQNPDQPVATLPLLTDRERQQILSWNPTLEASFPADIIRLFETQAATHPGAIAVEFESQSLTYEELNHRSNQLAHYLKSQGVQANTLVGVHLTRSLDLIVALFGVLKAGAAYVPLDPQYPADRLAYMMADADLSIVLTHREGGMNLPNKTDLTICLDSDWETIRTYSIDNLERDIDSDYLAYIIYTSGSTGAPKGVMISYGALHQFVQSAIAEYQITERDRVLQFASISFDAAVEEIYPCLCVGGTLVLRSDQMVSDATNFLAACDSLNLTVLDLPTAYWSQIALELQTTEINLPDALRLVIIGGEAVIAEPVNCWQQWLIQHEAIERITLINTYGPTETTVTATRYKIDADCYDLTIPIGRPLPHLQTYILDRHQQLVPIGIPGELYIGGLSLASGYLNQPDLTHDRFISSPFQPAARLYKTGDVVRYRTDGTIEFLGRSDTQVKIRGFRIELGEIETVLNQHPAIAQTVVLAREDHPGNKRLVAYVIAHPTHTPSVDELRQFVACSVPNYMVPSAWVMLEAFPVTPNGKIDRKALPAPDSSIQSSDRSYVAPRSDLERQLVELWEAVLQVSGIGVEDNFFELGGHSLLAVQLIAQIQQRWERSLPLTHLFQSPTIAQLARILSEEIASEWSPLVRIQPNGTATPLFCVAGSDGLVASFHHLARYLGSDQPLYALQPRGIDGILSPYTEIEPMAAEYLNAIQTVQPEGPYHLLGYSFGAWVVFELALQLQQLGHTIASLTLLDISSPTGVRLDSTRELTNSSDLWQSLEQLLEIADDDRTNSIQQILESPLLTEHESIMSQLLPVESLSVMQVQDARGILSVMQASANTIYQPSDRVSVPLTLIVPEQIRSLSLPENLSHDPTLGWKALTTQSVRVQQISGTHYTMLHEPHVQVLARHVQSILSPTRTALCC